MAPWGSHPSKARLAIRRERKGKNVPKSTKERQRVCVRPWMIGMPIGLQLGVDLLQRGVDDDAI
jgi:hypothetical protein